jgi:hypothetical protein
LPTSVIPLLTDRPTMMAVPVANNETLAKTSTYSASA